MITQTVAPFIDLSQLQRAFPGQPGLVVAFSETFQAAADAAAQGAVTAQTTETQTTSPVLCYAPSGIFTNERVLTGGAGVSLTLTDAELLISIAAPVIAGGNSVTFITTGTTSLILPQAGSLATVDRPETLANKTLDKPLLSSWGNYANDAAAATGGVPVGGVYRNGSAVMVRVA